jgi:hypothetical protein
MAFSQQTQADFTAQRYKVLHDPIHKYMTLDDSVLNVIDTPQFQRLRELKQASGFLDLALEPGASAAAGECTGAACAAVPSCSASCV